MIFQLSAPYINPISSSFRSPNLKEFIISHFLDHMFMFIHTDIAEYYIIEMIIN